MGKNQVNLTFTQKEYSFLSNRALLKKKTLWTLLQSDMNKTFGGIAVLEECCGDKTKVCKTITIPDRIWKVIVCLSRQLGISPGQLVYRIIIAPHLIEIATEGRLVAEVKSAD